MTTTTCEIAIGRGTLRLPRHVGDFWEGFVTAEHGLWERALRLELKGLPSSMGTELRGLIHASDAFPASYTVDREERAAFWYLAELMSHVGIRGRLYSAKLISVGEVFRVGA